MVQIDRPDGQVAVGQSDVDSQAITKDGISVDDDSAVAAGEPLVGRGFAGSERVDADEAQPVAPADPLQWQSEKARRSRQVALVVAVSLVGLLSAVVVFSWFVHAWRQRSQTASANVVSAQTLDQSPTTALTATDLSQQTDASSSPPFNSAAATSSSPQSPPNPTAETQTAKAQIADSQTSDSQTAGKEQLASPESIPNDLMPQSPIAPLDSPETTQAPENELGQLQELPPELAKFMPFLLQEGATDAPTLKAPPTMDQITLDAPAEDDVDPLMASKSKTLNLKADLAIQLALDSAGYPLADLMLLISQITGVPIQVDWVSFDLVGIDIDATVPTPKGWRSAHQLLQESVSALGGEIREEETLLICTVADASFAQTMAGIADLSDFADARASAEAVLAEFLRDDEDAPAKKLELGHSREQQQLAALAIESLRRMRGIQPKVADRRVRHWARASENESIQWPLLLKGDAGPQLDAPITIADMLRRDARRNQVVCVVNWLDANRQGVSPVQLLLPHAGADAATTLDQTLSPFGLQVRQVDSRHWWVGSAATYDRLPVVVWTPPLGKERDAFLQRIQVIMAGASRDAFRVSIDPASDRALLLLPRFIAAQLPKITPAIAAN